MDDESLFEFFSYDLCDLRPSERSFNMLAFGSYSLEFLLVVPLNFFLVFLQVRKGLS